MKASPDLLYALSEKLNEIADKTVDLETKSELNELSEGTFIDVEIDAGWTGGTVRCIETQEDFGCILHEEDESK
jgi:hypothetical protein